MTRPRSSSRNGATIPACRKDILIRHLATHTSGIEDAEQDEGFPHDQLTGWKGDFWKRRPAPNDPFSIARDVAPVLDVPGTRERYSNPGMAMLGYCITAAIKGTAGSGHQIAAQAPGPGPDRTPASSEWSIGYGKPVVLEGLSLYAPWGGASYSADATARVGRLMMHGGNWQGRQLLDADFVRTATTFAGMPNHSGLGWWVNSQSRWRQILEGRAGRRLLRLGRGAAVSDGRPEPESDHQSATLACSDGHETVPFRRFGAVRDRAGNEGDHR